jgi:hypothetical protein
MANAMMTASAPILDVLYDLVAGEMNSIFRFLGGGSPYLDRAGADLRRPLREMIQANERQIGELMAAVDSLGGVLPPESTHPEEQYLAFLSLKFLLPKLIEDKRSLIERFENALRVVGSDAPADIVQMLDRHLESHRGHLAALRQAESRYAETGTGLSET